MGAVRPDAIVVPQLAVQQGTNGHLVYVVKQDNVAEVRPVVGRRLLRRQGHRHRQPGLQKGDRVVVDGVLKVVPGQPVKVVEPGAPKTEASKT